MRIFTIMMTFIFFGSLGIKDPSWFHGIGILCAILLAAIQDCKEVWRK